MNKAPIEENETGIAIWGPVGSGKDWLINGFAKELEYYNNTDVDFMFELTDEDGNPIIPKPLSRDDIKPTAESEDYVLRFTRRPKAKTDEHSHSVSTYQHKINIHNDPGGRLLEALSKQEGSTYQTLVESRYIIVVLDPGFLPFETELDEGQVKKNSNEYLSIVKKGSSLTPKEYKLAIQTLLTTLSEKTATQKRYLAICLTKMDKKGIRGNSWDLLRRLFGSDMHEILKKYKTNFEIEVFSTSAAGYIKNPGSISSRKSNEEDGKIKDKDKWNPINTATPFFWIFENKEKERLKSSDIESYIEYPTRSN